MSKNPNSASPTEDSVQVISGELLEMELTITTEELCRSCSLQTGHVVELVQEGILEVQGKDLSQWRFQVTSIRRVRAARRLQRDLGVNLAGAALALDLLDRIAELERHVKR